MTDVVDRNAQRILSPGTIHTCLPHLLQPHSRGSVAPLSRLHFWVLQKMPQTHANYQSRVNSSHRVARTCAILVNPQVFLTSSKALRHSSAPSTSVRSRETSAKEGKWRAHPWVTSESDTIEMWLCSNLSAQGIVLRHSLRNITPDSNRRADTALPGVCVTWNLVNIILCFVFLSTNVGILFVGEMFFVVEATLTTALEVLRLWGNLVFYSLCSFK